MPVRCLARARGRVGSGPGRACKREGRCLIVQMRSRCQYVWNYGPESPLVFEPMVRAKCFSDLHR